VKNAKRRRAFYSSSQHIANGLLNAHFFDASVPDECVLWYRNGHFFLVTPVLVSRASLERFILEHIQRLNAHPSALNDPEQQIAATAAKIRSIVWALQKLVAK
jgi:hypothetical protein